MKLIYPKFKVIVEYEYPVEHKTPVKAELILHGDRVETWDVKLLEQEPVIDKIRAEIERLQTYVLCKGDTKKIELADVLEILDKYKAETEADNGKIDCN